MADIARPTLGGPAIVRATKSSIQLCFNDLLDKAANPLAQVGLDRIKPGAEEMSGGFTVSLAALVFMVTFVMAWSPFRPFSAR